MWMSLTEAYPIESKPLNNNFDTWNFGEGWLIFNPRNSADPSASALIAGDPHVKKSKITPKSIFIAPNSYTGNESSCPPGFRVDSNGKCIQTVTINQDEILAARISELFGGNNSGANKNSDFDSDYYDFDDETKSDTDSGPLQFNLPLSIIDVEEETDGKKVEYVIEEKVVNMRNLNPKEATTTEKPDETTTIAPVTENTETVPTDEPIASSTAPTELAEESATVTETVLPETSPETSTIKGDEDDLMTSTLEPTTAEPITTTSSTTTTQEPTTTTTTAKKIEIFSVDFLPKSHRKSNRWGPASARLKNYQDRQDKLNRPRKQKTTAISTKSNDKVVTKLYKIDNSQAAKKNRTRGSKRPGHRKLTTTTEVYTEAPVTTEPTTPKPFWWLPKGWSIDETKEKPVLVRFWSQQPLQQDERARSHSSRQRVNSRMPSDNIFREVTMPEVESLMKK